MPNEASTLKANHGQNNIPAADSCPCRENFTWHGHRYSPLISSATNGCAGECHHHRPDAIAGRSTPGQLPQGGLKKLNNAAMPSKLISRQAENEKAPEPVLI
jgi:hypothetical protein